MRNFIKSTLMAVAMAACTPGADPGVRPLTETRSIRIVPAVAESGQPHVLELGIRVDLDLPGGKSGKGKLNIFFSPSTGLFMQAFELDLNTPQTSWIDTRYSRVGIAADRLLIVTFGNGVGITESTEKAASLDDAEVKSLQWISDHLANVEARSWRSTLLPVDRSAFPEGFFRSGYDSRPVLPVTLVDLAWHDGDWELTLENQDTRRRVKLLISRKAGRFAGGEWSLGSMHADDAEKQE